MPSTLKGGGLVSRSKVNHIDSRFRGNDGSCLYGVSNMTQGGFSDSLLDLFRFPLRPRPRSLEGGELVSRSKVNHKTRVQAEEKSSWT